MGGLGGGLGCEGMEEEAKEVSAGILCKGRIALNLNCPENQLSSPAIKLGHRGEWSW